MMAQTIIISSSNQHSSHFGPTKQYEYNIRNNLSTVVSGSSPVDLIKIKDCPSHSQKL